MRELEILEKYLLGKETYSNSVKKINSIIETKKISEQSKYNPILRCIKSYEFGTLCDFCTHLRQTLGNFSSSIRVSQEIYENVLPYKKRYGFVMTDNGSYEINIRNEMLTNVPDLQSSYLFEKRKGNPVSISNGAVYKFFHYTSFTSLQQKMMMYFVCNLKMNQTLLACLPTGAGKSFSWQFMAISEMHNGCIIVVVPTIALAVSHEKSANELFNRVDGFLKKARAYSSELKADGRKAIYNDLDNDRLSLLFVSPEALLTEEFKTNIIKAAENGKVSTLIVDEVHLVVSWGMKFRPEFQLLPSLRNELQNKSPLGIRTILLSATITEFMIRYGVECLVKDQWKSEILEKLSDLDRANYLLLTYDEYYKIDSSWIGGPIVFFLTNDGSHDDEIYEMGQYALTNDNPVVFVGKASAKINSEKKTIKELVNYNTPLDNVIEGEYL